MTNQQKDTRSAEQRARDEHVAAEPHLPLPELLPETVESPVEVHLARLQRRVSIAGIVENSVVRPVDPSVRLPEQSRVIIVMSDVT